MIYKYIYYSRTTKNTDGFDNYIGNISDGELLTLYIRNAKIYNTRVIVRTIG